MSEDPEESDLARMGRRVIEEPRMRAFPFLGWTVVMIPLDLVESRVVARVMIGTMWGLEPDELVDLPARRISMDDEPTRTWWVMAISSTTHERLLDRGAE